MGNLKVGWLRNGEGVCWQAMLEDIKQHPEHADQYVRDDMTLEALFSFMTQSVWCRRGINAPSYRYLTIQLTTDDGQYNADDFFLQVDPEICFVEVKQILKELYPPDEVIYVHL